MLSELLNWIPNCLKQQSELNKEVNIMDDYPEMVRAGSLLCDGKNPQEALNLKVSETINKFLGESSWVAETYTTKWYYWKLLAWTIKSVIKSRGWKIVSVKGYSRDEPVIRDIQTDYTKFESCVIDGQLLLEKNNIRMIIIMDTSNSVQIEAGENHHRLVKAFINSIGNFLKKNNFYMGKKLNFESGISFLNAGQRDWDSVILDPAMKKEIRMNTIGFLNNCTQLEKYGIPPKRGIILAGEPGTGKTIVCKALMSEANTITCIATTAEGIVMGGYISELFSLAQDLSPSIIFIEDIDFIGQERQDYYRGGAPLISLLSEMDGIAEKNAIVTVATSNCYEALDKALSERPSRFDRVFRITRPNYQQRVELVKHISKKIPLSEEIREYVVKETNGFTPAQVQEVLHGMVISHSATGQDIMQFSRNDVDSTIALLNIRRTDSIGFNVISYSDANTNK
jgi:cell division protease FtsH